MMPYMPVSKLVLNKQFTDKEMIDKYQNTYIKHSHIKSIIRCDTDVYTETGKQYVRSEYFTREIGLPEWP